MNFLFEFDADADGGDGDDDDCYCGADDCGSEDRDEARRIQVESKLSSAQRAEDDSLRSLQSRYYCHCRFHCFHRDFCYCSAAKRFIY